ncbi:MAG TPA: sulfatase [Chitinophagales bacterium]|nr:sulfatase [Chitinophagales bacterium]
MLKLLSLILLFISSYHFISAQRPNIVIIMADDLDDFVTPLFFSEVLPVVDSIKRNGISFKNSFVATPVCCPSRAGLLSGKYGHKTNVLNNGSEHGGWLQFQDDERNALPAYLAEAGYTTAMIGKYLNGYEVRKQKLPPIPYGWTDGAVFVWKKSDPYIGYNFDLMEWKNGQAENDSFWKAASVLKHYGNKPEDYSTDVLARYAVDFIVKAAADESKPFFLYLTPTAPHFPLYAPQRHYGRTVEKWSNHPVPSQPNTFYDNGALATGNDSKIPLDKPWWIRQTWKKRIRQSGKGGQIFNRFWRTKVPQHIRAYKDADWFNRMGSLYALNDLISDVISILKEKDEWNNTLLIFTSDNGYQFGNHGLYQKSTPYEEAIRVPLVITGGAELNLRNKTEFSQWVLNLDLMPTILDLAGIHQPDSLDGKSLTAFILDDKEIPEWRDRFLIEYDGPGMAGFMSHRERLMIKLLPSYFSDLPSYRSIRMVIPMENDQFKTFKYIEWMRYPRLNPIKYRFEQNDRNLMRRISNENPRTLRRIERTTLVESELYNISDDPYEMDNLLYYQPQKYETLAGELRKAMKELLVR